MFVLSAALAGLVLSSLSLGISGQSFTLSHINPTWKWWYVNVHILFGANQAGLPSLGVGGSGRTRSTRKSVNPTRCLETQDAYQLPKVYLKGILTFPCISRRRSSAYSTPALPQAPFPLRPASLGQMDALWAAGFSSVSGPLLYTPAWLLGFNFSKWVVYIFFLLWVKGKLKSWQKRQERTFLLSLQSLRRPGNRQPLQSRNTRSVNLVPSVWTRRPVF